MQVDQRVFKDLMSEKLPRLHAHFEQYKVDFSLITFNWFLVVFVDSVVSDILFKIWDAFLFEGPKVRDRGENKTVIALIAHRQMWPGHAHRQNRDLLKIVWMLLQMVSNLVLCLGVNKFPQFPFHRYGEFVFEFPHTFVSLKFELWL